LIKEKNNPPARLKEKTMEEKKISFNQEAMTLEGLYARAEGFMGAVITHPHSLMGGDMWNPVVETLCGSIFAAGFSTLRFNFRGVGRSAGVFDEGQGEQQDVLAAVAFLADQGIREIMLAGYSFGAWVNAAVLARSNLLPAIFVAPPVDLLSFDLASLPGKVGLVVIGDKDQYCPEKRIKIVASELSCHLDIIPGADHFFMSKEKDLAMHIGSFTRKLKTTIKS
jgi:uncharacterized protein